MPPASVTRWLNYIFNVGPLTTMKISPIYKVFAQLVSKRCPIQNKPSKIAKDV